MVVRGAIPKAGKFYLHYAARETMCKHGGRGVVACTVAAGVLPVWWCCAHCMFISHAVVLCVFSLVFSVYPLRPPAFAVIR